MRSIGRFSAFRSNEPQSPRPFRWIDAVFRVHGDRVSLSEMPEHMRRDLGLSNRQIEDEIRRPFWDIPDWWR